MPDTLFDNGHRHLTDEDEMHEALKELMNPAKFPSVQYRGNVNAHWAAGSPRWMLEVGKEGVAKAVVDKAMVGDHLVVTYGTLLHLTDAEYQAAQ